MFFLRSIAWKILKSRIRRRFPDVQQLTVSDLAAWLKRSDTPLLLDARSPAEYQMSHLQNARLIASDPAQLAQWQDVTLTTPIVVYCSVGYRSAKLAQRLQAMGYQQVMNLEGSIFEWVNQKHPVFQQGNPVQQVHPYNQLWGLLLRHHARII